MLHSFLNTIQGTLQLTYLALDGYSGPSPKRGPRPRLGEQVDVHSIQDTYLKAVKVKDGSETHTYQMQLLHQDFPEPRY